MNIKQKIFDSIVNNRLNLIEGKRKWHNYIVNIQKLVWERNLIDGYLIDIYDLEENFLEKISIEIKPVIEFGSIHNKMFFKNMHNSYLN